MVIKIDTLAKRFSVVCANWLSPKGSLLLRPRADKREISKRLFVARAHLLTVSWSED